MQSQLHTMKFNHISFPSRDIAATADFFERHLRAVAALPGGRRRDGNWPDLARARLAVLLPGGVLVELNTRAGMPSAAVLSLHARVEGTVSEPRADSSLVQLWGPRFSAYVVAAEDHAVFSLGRLPASGAQLCGAEDFAHRPHGWLEGREMPYSEAGRGLNSPPNSFRYAAATGSVLIRWDGAGRPTVRTVRRPAVDPAEARLELTRRHLHVFGPSTAERFATWVGIATAAARAAYKALAPELVPVRTPTGEAWILAEQEALFRAPVGPVEGVRLLPSGDAYFLLQGATSRSSPGDPCHWQIAMRLWRKRKPWRCLALRIRRVSIGPPESPGVAALSGSRHWQPAVVVGRTWRPIAIDKGAIQALAFHFPDSGHPRHDRRFPQPRLRSGRLRPCRFHPRHPG